MRFTLSSFAVNRKHLEQYCFNASKPLVSHICTKYKHTAKNTLILQDKVMYSFYFYYCDTVVIVKLLISFPKIGHSWKFFIDDQCSQVV